MAEQSFYDILGVDRSADAAALKSAFRKRAMQYHPDRNKDDPNAEAKFKEVNEAYEILSDDQKRAAYDRFGKAAFENGHGGGAGGGFGAGQFSDVFEDIFGEFMGARNARRGGPGRGADVKYDLEITLEESFTGKKAEISVPGTVACEVCDGTGAKPGSGPVECGTCRGVGRVRMQQGFFTIERTCPTCNGEGRVIKDPCEACNGQGRVRKERTLSVDIPPGIEDGTRIRLSGEGEAGPRGGPEGDLYIFVHVLPHELFERDGADLYCVTPIPMTTAALGGEFEAPTIDGGRMRVNVGEGAQSGKRFRLRQKGMSRLNAKGRGDLYVEIQVETPTNLNPKQRALLQEFCEEGGSTECCPNSENFFQKARNFWDNVTDQ